MGNTVVKNVTNEKLTEAAQRINETVKWMNDFLREDKLDEVLSCIRDMYEITQEYTNDTTEVAE